MADSPRTVEDVLDRFDRADDDAAMRAAALVDGDVLAGLIDSLLADLDERDEWDLPAQLYVAAPTDHLEQLSGSDLAADLRRDEPSLDAAAAAVIAERLRAGVSLEADGQALVTFSLAQLSLGDGHPYDQLVGETLPRWAGAAVLVTEGWLHPSELDVEFGTAGSQFRRADGAAEVRMVTAVTRLGHRVSAVSARGGGRRVWCGDEPGTTQFGGPVPAALCRSLGIPAHPPSDRPWLTLGGLWASAVANSWERLAAQVGPHAAAAGALRIRPDVVMLTTDGMRETFAAACRRHGVDPLDDVAVEALIDRGLLGADAIELPPPARVFAAEEPDVDGLGQVSRQAAGELPGTDWEDVRRTVVPFAMAVQAGEPRPELMSWWDGPTAMYHYALVMPDHEAAAALRQVASLPRAPRWFRDTARTFREAAERTRLAPQRITCPDAQR